MSQRFHPKSGGDVPPTVAARRLGLTVEQLQRALPLLIGRGFPAPDETTGNYAIDAIEVWRQRRYPHLFADPAQQPQARNASDTMREWLAGIRKDG